MKRLSAAIMASLALASAAVAQIGPQPAPAAAVAFHIGAFSAWSLHDAQFAAPNDSTTFGVGQTKSDVDAVLQAADAPTDRILLSVNVLLVKTPGHVMLFDTGLGAGLHGGLLDSLALTGVKPDEVSDIWITHSHADHIGGLAAGGKLIFANAKIRMSSKEWTFMQGQNPSLSAIVAPKVATFEPGAAVIPGVTPISLPGHTPGHVGYQIGLGGARLLDIGDMAHSSIISLAKPEWTVQFDVDKAAGKTTRRNELTRLAATHGRVYAPHFPYPGVGEVVTNGAGFAWKPATLK